jgi:hypothetical protein
MRTVTLNPKQQRRVDILTRLDAGTLDVPAAATLLGVSARHVRRLHDRFCSEGMPVVVHGNQARPPVNRTDPLLVQRILDLVAPDGIYHDLNVSHLHDRLAEEETMSIGRSTLDRLLRLHGQRERRQPSRPIHRRRRQRRDAEGMLLQMDGSPFDWVEARGPRFTLLGAVDDATGKIVSLLFRPTEDQAGYFLLLRLIAQTHGLPMAIYHDRHTMLRSPKQPTLEEELAGHRPMSQVQRLLADLAIESIPAHSPQAKGRVERLWGTLQDRLVKELRLASITTMEDANAFLPGFIARYNARFAKVPQDPVSAWLPLPDGLDLAYHFAARETRTVRADHCIQWLGDTLQLLIRPGDPGLARKTVTVHVVPEGTVFVYHGTRQLAYRRVTEPTRAATEVVHRAPPTRAAPDPHAAARRRAWLFAQR